MATEDSVNLANTRIHAIVLTRDRPDTLRRCVTTALASLGAEDMLTIIDDSTQKFSAANSTLLDINSNLALPKRVYLFAPHAQETLNREVPKSDLVWLSRTASRDISPLRNLSLLLSAAVPAELTILIDDDICGFDLIATYHRARAAAQPNKGAIAGARIGGISEHDTVTRLTDALCILEDFHPILEEDLTRNLFCAEVSATTKTDGSVTHLSAGYLAFSLPRDQMFAFPPGYNEDWLWCLLYRGNPQVSVLRLGEIVVHDPPSVRKATRTDLLFELMGDLAFECLEELQVLENPDPETTLMTLRDRLPSPTSMPTNRVRKLLDKSQSLAQRGISILAIKEYGLGILASMLESGDLHIDWGRVLYDWCVDAIIKHRSFDAALRGNDVIPTLETLLQEGRL